MEYRKFGRTGLVVSPIGLGSVNMGWLSDEAESFAMLDHAFENGVNFIDTSNNYNAGKSEALLGRWFAQGGGRRERTVLASKVYCPPNDWGSSDPIQREGRWVGPNQRGLSAKHIREACDASLRRLQTDYIDVYQMHHIDRRVPWEELWQAMEILIQQGKVLYVGSSNFAGWHIAQCQERADRRNLLGLVSEQSVYNLVKRTVELEVLPACRSYGLAFLPYSPLAAGALAGKVSADIAGRRNWGGAKPASNIEGYEALCRELELAPSDVALAWLASRPGVTAPIVGPRTLGQFKANLAAVQLKLDPTVLTRLDELFPGPSGPAPEAYAW
jgi:NDP-hexose C3-ketoreductase / dTDP-4-oxo-2-deoxy-alpha-D-pentos-2-ene 2,3-reductase